MLMGVAWTSLFHAIFFQRKIKPWHLELNSGNRKRYVKVDGEPRHWELSSCLKEYWQSESHPQRRNLEFFIGLRNKIEHRNAPELDPALYGECQAMLTNYNDLLTSEFGKRHALTDALGLALQFSALRPSAQIDAVRRLQSQSSKDLRQYVETFRANLPPEILASSDYSLKVFLVPKLTNNISTSDLAIEFLNVDHLGENELEQLNQMVALIKEKHVPIASAGLVKPGVVVDTVSDRLPFEFNQWAHTQAWKHYQVRPSNGSESPGATKPEYCVYDELNGNYGYTQAWIIFLCDKLADAGEYQRVTGKLPKPPKCDGS